MGPAVVERAECDAQWISIADAAQAQVKASQDIPPAVVRFVHRRDHGRCRVPGCRSTRCLEIHHIIHRANGGTHDVWNLILVCSSCHQAHHDGRLVISGTADKLAVVRPAEPKSHVEPASPLANAIARTQAKATLMRMRWKAGVARAAIDRVAADLPPDATAESLFQAAIKLDTSDVRPTSSPDPNTEARSALISMGWSVAVARAAIECAAPELPVDAPVEEVIRLALKHCPSPLHAQVRARDGAGPTWSSSTARRLPRLQEILGHRDIKTTMRYMHTSDDAGPTVIRSAADSGRRGVRSRRVVERGPDPPRASTA